MTLPVPNAMCLYGDAALAEGYDFTRDGPGAELLNVNPTSYGDVLLDPFRTSPGAFAMEKMRPITSDRAKCATLLSLVFAFIMHGKRVTVYLPGIHDDEGDDARTPANARTWRDHQRRGVFESKLHDLLWWADTFKGHELFWLCNDGSAGFGVLHPSTYMVLTEIGMGHNVAVESFAPYGHPLINLHSMTTADVASRHSDFENLSYPDRHAVLVTNDQTQGVYRWRMAGHAIYLAASYFTRGWPMPEWMDAPIGDPAPGGVPDEPPATPVPVPTTEGAAA